jgi:hypothetical protein
MVSITPPPAYEGLPTSVHVHSSPHRPSRQSLWQDWRWILFVVISSLGAVVVVHHVGARVDRHLATRRFTARLQAQVPSAEAYCPEYTPILQQALAPYEIPGRTVSSAAMKEVDDFVRGTGGMRIHISAKDGKATMTPKVYSVDKRRRADLLENIRLAQQLFGKLPFDVEFWYNSEDGPALPRELFRSNEGVLLPPLGYTTTTGHYDVSIPYTKQAIWKEDEDLAALSELVHKHPWAGKAKRGVWRGSTTGSKRVEESNIWTLPRSVLVNMSLHNPEVLDARFTECKQCDSHVASLLEKAGFGYARFFTFADQFKYQALIDVDGNTWSSRFAQLLSINSVVFKQETKYVEFFRPLVKPYRHYIPVKGDLSDLASKLHAMLGEEGSTNKTAQQELREVGAESTRLYIHSLVPSKQLCYLHRVLEAYSRVYAQAVFS